MTTNGLTANGAHGGGTPAVDVRQVHKRFRSNGAEVHALRGIDLTIAPGEFVAVMGASGCGKSTLLHLLGGLDVPTSGEVVVAGHALHDLGESARAVLRREAIGFVFQSFNLVPNLSVADNIELPGLLARRPSAAVRERREALLDELRLSGRARAFPGELSGGEQQRVALARALLNQPALLLADEPTGNLDSSNSNGVLVLLRRIHEQGQTIVLVTHDFKVASAAERVVFMRDGNLVDEARPREMRDPGASLARLVMLGG